MCFEVAFVCLLASVYGLRLVMTSFMARPCTRHGRGVDSSQRTNRPFIMDGERDPTDVNIGVLFYATAETFSLEFIFPLGSYSGVNHTNAPCSDGLKLGSLATS